MYTSGIARELVNADGGGHGDDTFDALCSDPGDELFFLQAVGIRSGSADLKEKANVLRILIGENATSRSGRTLGRAGERDRNESR